jgi:hypothetical protein
MPSGISRNIPLIIVGMAIAGLLAWNIVRLVDVVIAQLGGNNEGVPAKLQALPTPLLTAV